MASTAMELPKPTGLLKKRSQVKSACINCRKAKTACSHQRPCNRCETLGISDSCHDVPRKKRGKRTEENLEGSDNQNLHLVDFCKKYLDFKLETEITIQPKNSQKCNKNPPNNCTYSANANTSNINNSSSNVNTVCMTSTQYPEQIQHSIVANDSLNSKSMNYFSADLPLTDPFTFIDNSNLVNFNFDSTPSKPFKTEKYQEQQYSNFSNQQQMPYSQEISYTDFSNMNSNNAKRITSVQTRYSNNLESTSPSQTQSPDTISLINEIERLSKEKDSLEQMVNSLTYSSPERFFFSKVALSRWKFDYYCSLDSCSGSFSKLVGRPVDQMRNGVFKCIELFQPHIRGSTQPLTDLLASGRVASCSVNQLFYNPKLQKDIVCHSNLQVEFDDSGNPTHIVMSSQEFDVTDRDLNFFHAYYVKLRPIKTLPNSLPYPVPRLCG